MTDVVDAAHMTGWVTISQLARLIGMSRQAVHKRVRKLEQDEKIEVRRRGKSVLVDVSAFRSAVDATADPDRGDQPPSYSDAKRRKVEVELAIKEIELARRRGELLSVRDVETAAMAAGRRIAARLEGMTQWADELVSLAHKHGADGVRQFLKSKAGSMRESAAADLESISRMRVEDGRS